MTKEINGGIKLAQKKLFTKDNTYLHKSKPFCTCAPNKMKN